MLSHSRHGEQLRFRGLYSNYDLYGLYVGLEPQRRSNHRQWDVDVVRTLQFITCTAT